jgi:hypothetical protein
MHRLTGGHVLGSTVRRAAHVIASVGFAGRRGKRLSEIDKEKMVGNIPAQLLSASSDLQSDSMGFGSFDQPASDV